MTAAAFKANYSDWKPIKSRRVIQIVFEVPWERHDEAYQALGGMSDPAHERWFAIARLDERKVMPAAIDKPTTDTPPRLESNASAGADKCVMVAYGGAHCVGRCQEPKDCSGTPLPADKPRRKFEDLTPAQQAGILCGQQNFRVFLNERFHYNTGSADEAAEAVRELCKVTSRALLTTDNTEWKALLLAFRLWENHPELEDA